MSDTLKIIDLHVAVEDKPIEDFTLFPALFEAISNGDAHILIYRTPATGQTLATRTVVPMTDRENWEQLQMTSIGDRLGHVVTFD